jgi:hypothetical protein
MNAISGGFRQFGKVEPEFGSSTLYGLARTLLGGIVKNKYSTFYCVGT